MSMQKRKIVSLEPFCKEHLERIKQAAGEEFNVEEIPLDAADDVKRTAIQSAEILIGEPPVDWLQEPAQNCPNLKLLQMLWAGTDIYTRSPLPFPAEVMLSNASGVYGLTISQFVICQVLTLMLNFKAYHEQQKKKVWERRGPIQSLDNARVLIFGAGDIGSTTAKRLLGFDAYTIGVCRDTSRPRKYFNELCTLDEAEKFLPQADVVICCIPNSEQTAGYMNANRLKLMKQGAILVNVGRGNFVDCMALNEELTNGHLWGAALDVTMPEPLPSEHPLWENPRCLITPHTSGVAFAHLPKTEELLCDLVCENLLRYNNGKELKNRVL